MSKMTKRERVISVAPAKNPRAVVSVSLRIDEHAQIAQEARRRGMKTSEFIREVAVRAASPEMYQYQAWPLSAAGVTTFQLDAQVRLAVRPVADQAIAPMPVAV